MRTSPSSWSPATAAWTSAWVRPSGAALRNHNLIILEYDNQGYMNTGASSATPRRWATGPPPATWGPPQAGKRFHHKDTAQIMAACHIPYVFTGTEAFPEDLVRKAAKAQ